MAGSLEFENEKKNKPVKLSKSEMSSIRGTILPGQIYFARSLGQTYLLPELTITSGAKLLMTTSDWLSLPLPCSSAAFTCSVAGLVRAELVASRHTMAARKGAMSAPPHLPAQIPRGPGQECETWHGNKRPGEDLAVASLKRFKIKTAGGVVVKDISQ